MGDPRVRTLAGSCHALCGFRCICPRARGCRARILTSESDPGLGTDPLGSRLERSGSRFLPGALLPEYSFEAALDTCKAAGLAGAALWRWRKPEPGSADENYGTFDPQALRGWL